MFKCSMCKFESGDNLVILKHVVGKHKNNPSFQIQCQFGGCARTFQKWDSFTKHLRRNHQNDVPLEALEENINPPENPDPPPIEDLRDVDSDQDSDSSENYVSTLSPEELLSWKAGKFLSVLREKANTSQRALNLVVEQVNDIMVSFVNKIHVQLKAAKENPADTSLSFEDIGRIFTEIKSQGLFDGVSSQYLLDQFLTAHGKVTPVEVVLGMETVWNQSVPPKIIMRKVSGYILPLEASLRQLLSHPEIQNYLLNPYENTDGGTLKDMRDGSFYKSHVLFSRDRYALIIVFYYDDLQTSNVLGSKPHKFSMFYWTLGNIPPHLRSSLRAINLYGVVRTKHLRKFGAAKVLSSFVADIKKLQTEGISVVVKRREKIFRGSILFSTADSPPLRSWVVSRKVWRRQRSLAGPVMLLRKLCKIAFVRVILVFVTKIPTTTRLKL